MDPLEDQLQTKIGQELPFVVLHHTGHGPDHYDLLLEVPNRDRLPTWQITAPPTTWPKAAPQAQRLPDHRRLYLTYEGPISQNRGQVQRALTGTAQVLQQTPTTLTLQLRPQTPNSPGVPIELPL